jgi:cobalamin biosynthesis Mg chelatase CobN
MVPTAAYAGILAPSTTDGINATFNSDMQSGQVQDAVAAAVERTAGAIAAVTPALPAQSTTTTAAGPATPAQSQVPSVLPTPAAAAPANPGHRFWIVVLILVIIALVVLVAVATRKESPI